MLVNWLSSVPAKSVSLPPAHWDQTLQVLGTPKGCSLQSLLATASEESGAIRTRNAKQRLVLGCDSNRLS